MEECTAVNWLLCCLIQFMCVCADIKRGLLHLRSHEKGWVLWFQRVKDRFVLPRQGKTNLSFTRWNQRTQPFSCADMLVYAVVSRILYSPYLSLYKLSRGHSVEMRAEPRGPGLWLCVSHAGKSYAVLYLEMYSSGGKVEISRNQGVSLDVKSSK